MTRALPLCLVAMLCCGPGLGIAQEPAPPPGQDVTAVVDPANVRAQLRLAFPRVDVRGAVSAEAHHTIQEMETALREDLLRTGIFVLQGPSELSVLEITGERATDFELYRSLANEIVLLVEAYQDGDRVALEGRLFDLASHQSIVGKRYRGTYELARRIAHTFTDEIVLYFTGRRGIALTSIAFYSDRSGDKEIYIMDYDGRNVRPLTGHKSISTSPAWSPLGDAIAYVSFFAGAPSIYVVNLETGAKNPVVNDGGFNSAPSFSPDGRQLVFSRSLGGNTEIFLANRDGSALRRLTNSAGIDTNPAWSPTGQQIVFTSSRAGNPHLYVMDVEGTNLRRVTFEGTYNDGAAWSPDGAKIAYASRRGNSFDVALTDLALLETKVLTQGLPGSHESPSFSPDGRLLAYSTSHRGRTQIQVMPVDGGPVESLTHEGNNFSPSWSAYPR